ncbi:MAG: glycosyltransferase family 2 protein [Deinococcus sp.]|nr:glycosyltransferase family 2 protein [Deinococcus sp.]
MGASQTKQGPGSWPSVAIILLNWNGWRDTLACLASLEKLDYPNYQIVVVDNGSTDESVARIRGSFPHAYLLKAQKNLGFSGGSNIGIHYALEHGADYIWLLNNDTVVEANTLRALVATAEANPRIGAVGSVLHYMNQPKRVQAWGGGWVKMLLGVTGLHQTLVPVEKLDYISGASVLVRSKALEEVGVLDDRFFLYWEDTDLSFRLRKAGWLLQVADEARVFHKGFASVGPRSLLLDRYFNVSAAHFFQKHSTIPLIPIVIGIGSRMVKRVLQGRFSHVLYVLRDVRRRL